MTRIETGELATIVYDDIANDGSTVTVEDRTSQVGGTRHHHIIVRATSTTYLSPESAIELARSILTRAQKALDLNRAEDTK